MYNLASAIKINITIIKGKILKHYYEIRPRNTISFCFNRPLNVKPFCPLLCINLILSFRFRVVYVIYCKFGLGRDSDITMNKCPSHVR